MPGGDGTGPMGEGPMTGRGMGFCNGNQIGFGRGRGPGRGLGRGRGPGRGPGRGMAQRNGWGGAGPNNVDAGPELQSGEVAELSDCIRDMQSQISQLQDKLDSLAKKK